MLERKPIEDDRASPPLACEDIDCQVAIVHSCMRDPEGLRHQQCMVKHMCQAHSVELSSCSSGCTEHSQSYSKDDHNPHRVLFEVIDREAGFTGRTQRTGEFENDISPQPAQH